MKKYLIISLLPLLILGCAKTKSDSFRKKYSESRPLFGTVVELTSCYDWDGKEKLARVFQKVWQRFEEMQWKMNILDERSDIVKINNSRQKPVAIGKDTYQLLKDSVYYFQLTQGIFDVTVYPLIELWRESEKKGRPPSHSDILRTKKAVGSGHIEFLPDQRIRLRSLQAKIDINGIAAGYGADEAARIFRENKVENFLADTGGELFAGGVNCEGIPWRVGVHDPQNASGTTEVLGLTNQGVSTSGSYEHYFDIQGQKWSYLVNPITGYPERNIVSATVIAPSAEEADALSTALCILGGKQALKFLDSLDHPVDAVIIEQAADGKLVEYKTKNYHRLQIR